MITRAFPSSLLVAVASIAFGCGVPQYKNCEKACGTSGAICPPGMECKGGFCSAGRWCGADGGAETSEVSDAGTDVDAQPDTPIDGPDRSETPSQWTPAMIPNLVIWLEGDRGIDAAPGEPIRVWRDQSGQGNDAQQPDAMLRPKLAGNAVNGSPAVAFDGKAWMAMLDTRTLRWGVGNFYLVIAFRVAFKCSGCYQQALYHKNNEASPYAGPSLYVMEDGRGRTHITESSQDPGQDLFSTAADLDDGRPRLLAVQRTSGVVTLRLDGVAVPGPIATTVTNVDAPSQNAIFGAHGIQPDTFGLNGQIAAIIAVASALSVAELMQLERYLMTKYGIAPPN